MAFDGAARNFAAGHLFLAAMRPLARLLVACLGMLALCGSVLGSVASASTTQIALFQPGAGLLEKPTQTLAELHSLGVEVVRVPFPWSSIAPAASSMKRPAKFKASDPGAYPAAHWAPYDNLVRAADAIGIQLDVVLTGGAPLWADRHPVPRTATKPTNAWLPSASEFGAFAQAVGTRYGGSFTPPGETVLPRVSFWALWNEPNFGADIAPQATNGSTILSAAVSYRGLLDAGWRGLQASNHGHDTVLIGSLAARGSQSKPTRSVPDGRPGVFGQTKPLQFIRALYCVDAADKPLTGSAARVLNCPGRSSTFRSAHPGLFAASGFAIHPYPFNTPPPIADTADPDYAEFAQIPRLESTLDTIQRTYGSQRTYPIYITEYGYVTNPPNRSAHFVSPATAATYINWAEYLSYRNPRIASTMQFLLADPNPRVGVPEFGGFASGLEFFGGKHKPAYDAYRMPLFLPVTSAKRGQSLEVWGAVRPAFNAAQLSGQPQTVAIQFRRGSTAAFSTLKTVSITSPRGYFDIRVSFPASGSVRLEWTGTSTFHSRTQQITVR